MPLSVEAPFCFPQEGILAVEKFSLKEETMRILAAIFGIVLIVLVFQDAFESVVLPRRVVRRIRITRLFYLVTWNGWKSLSRIMRPGTRRARSTGIQASSMKSQIHARVLLKSRGLCLVAVSLPQSQSRATKKGTEHNSSRRGK